MNGRTNSSDVTVTEVVVQEGVSIPLEAPTSFSGTSGDGTATITWTDPLNKYANPGGELVSDWSHDIVVRKQGSAPSSPTDGVQVLQTTSRDQVASDPYVDSGLTNDQEYYYGIYAYNQFGLESEALIGSVIPTSFGTLAYTRTINTGVDTDGSDGQPIFTASNDAIGYIFVSTGMPPQVNTGKTINGDLVLSNYDHSPYFSFGNYAILGTSTIIFGASDVNDYTKYIIKIDGNSVITQIRESDNTGTTADANHQAIYQETRSGSVTRYDTNLVARSVGSTRSYSWDHASLSHKYYAMFTGYATSGSNSDVGYVYDVNGTRKQFSTPLCRGQSSSASCCDEYMLVFGGSESASSRVDSNKCYAISADVVVQQLADLPDVFAYGQESNIQSHKLGIVLHDHLTDNHQVWQVAYYDKRLTFQKTITNGWLSYVDGSERRNIRVGNYLAFRGSSDQIGYLKGQKYLHIYENP